MPQQTDNTRRVSTRTLISLVAVAAVAFVALAASTPEATPRLVLPCTVTEVYDGDTITVELTIRSRVRLVDCWAPELSDAGGEASAQHLRRIAAGKPGLLSIDLGGVDRVDDVFSFGRVLGRVSVAGDDLGGVQIRFGHATATRQK